MAARFLSIMQTADRLADDGPSSAEQKVFGEWQRWPRRITGYLDSMISSQTRSPNGKAIRANRESRFASCLTRPTASKAPRFFNTHRFETETPWQFGCRRLLNQVRLSFMARVIFTSFPSCCAGN